MVGQKDDGLCPIRVDPRPFAVTSKSQSPDPRLKTEHRKLKTENTRSAPRSPHSSCQSAPTLADCHTEREDSAVGDERSEQGVTRSINPLGKRTATIHNIPSHTLASVDANGNRASSMTRLVLRHGL